MIHLGRRPSREGWTSFETDSHLRRTKDRLYRRCLPCLTGLLEQLKAGAREIDLGPAWTCWKVAATTASRDECLAVLERFGEAFPDEPCHGKFGVGGGGHATFAVIFHTESERARDRLETLLRTVVDRDFPRSRVFHSRGCGIPYEQLLGPWREWRPVTPIRHPDCVDRVKRHLVDSLYRQGA